jgi:hypothetical protein
MGVLRTALGVPSVPTTSEHRRIMAQAFGVVHVIISGETPEHGLPKQPD